MHQSKLKNLYFFTATNLNWQHALYNDRRKQLVLDSLDYLVKNNRIKVFAFVIMPNHVHILWFSLIEDITSMKLLVQGSFLKYTSRNILQDMNEYEKESYLVEAKDRKYQIWERNPLWVECFNLGFTEQKLSYIHNNPYSSRKSGFGKDYTYSSESFYEDGEDRFGFLTNLYDWFWS